MNFGEKVLRALGWTYAPKESAVFTDACRLHSQSCVNENLDNHSNWTPYYFAGFFQLVQRRSP